MPKVTRRKKLDTKVKKLENTKSATLSNEQSTAVKESLFAGLDINPSQLTTPQALLDQSDKQSVITVKGRDWDTKSAVSAKSFRGLSVPKKDKQRIRHEAWMNKVDRIKRTKEEQKKREKRQQTVIVGDMQPMADALPTLDLLMRSTGHNPHMEKNRKPESKKPLKKMKQRQKMMVKQVEVFHQIRKDATFKKKPFAAITEHLRLKLQQEGADLT